MSPCWEAVKDLLPEEKNDTKCQLIVAGVRAALTFKSGGGRPCQCFHCSQSKQNTAVRRVVFDPAAPPLSHNFSREGWKLPDPSDCTHARTHTRAPQSQKPKKQRTTATRHLAFSQPTFPCSPNTPFKTDTLQPYCGHKSGAIKGWETKKLQKTHTRTKPPPPTRAKQTGAFFFSGESACADATKPWR